MDIVASVVSALETILGEEVEVLAAKHDVIKRKRKFTGQTLLQMLVLTLMKNPDASYADMAATAAQLGVEVSETAVKKRFTQPLVNFLRDAVSLAIEQIVAAEPVNVELLGRFTAVEIGDSSSMKLPDELKDLFPGCGGNTEASGLAAVKIQVRWDLKTGGLPQILIETGKSSDAKSPITQREPVVGSLEIFDLGYFSLERFQNLDDKGALYISRLQHGTHILDKNGIAVDLQQFLSKDGSPEVIDTPILLGTHHQLPTRMIAIPCSEEVVNRRRQKAFEKAKKHGRQPSAELLALLYWSIYITNVPPEKLTWKEAVVLYRTRWQIELLFKLWKSHNHLDKHPKDATPKECMARLWAKFIGSLMQHWLLLLCGWHDERRSLWKLANALREWVVALIATINDHKQLVSIVTNIRSNLLHVVPIRSRTNKPSNFQLLNNPELLTWGSKV